MKLPCWMSKVPSDDEQLKQVFKAFSVLNFSTADNMEDALFLPIISKLPYQ